MTLEELRELREAYDKKKGAFGIAIPGLAVHDELFDLAEAMLKIKAVALKTDGIVGIYRTSWREDPVWMADCDFNLTTLGDCESDDLVEAISELHGELCPSHSSPTGDSAPSGTSDDQP